jgi:AraC-like DNA-binding protein
VNHASVAGIEYRPVRGLPGVDTLRAERLRLAFDRHFHDSYSFGLILGGVERCSLRGTRHHFEAGTVPMFNPGEVHDGGPATEQGWSYRMVYLDPSLIEGERLFPLPVRNDPPARRAAAALFDAIDCGSELGIDEALSSALDVLLEAPRRPQASPALSGVRERIDADFSEPLRLRDLALGAGLSPTRLLRAFEAAHGLTPHRYQQSRRVAKAKQMIVAGAALADVAAACGYSDQSHLNRWFLRIQGTTPGRLRRAFFS